MLKGNVAPRGRLFPIKQGFVGGVVFGQEPQSIHRTPVTLFILRTGSQVLCGRWGGGGSTCKAPRRVPCPLQLAQARWSAPVQCCEEVQTAWVPCGGLPAPLLLPASERVGQAPCGTCVGCRAAS